MENTVQCMEKAPSPKNSSIKQRITESIRLENTSEIESNLWPITTVSSRPQHLLLHTVFSFSVTPNTFQAFRRCVLICFPAQTITAIRLDPANSDMCRKSGAHDQHPATHDFPRASTGAWVFASSGYQHPWSLIKRNIFWRVTAVHFVFFFLPGTAISPLGTGNVPDKCCLWQRNQWQTRCT